MLFSRFSSFGPDFSKLSFEEPEWGTCWKVGTCKLTFISPSFCIRMNWLKPPRREPFASCASLANPKVETKSKKQKEKSMNFLWQLWERCLASQSVCLRWTSQSVLWCCSIALFTSASCSKPIWSEAHGVLTTISTSVNRLRGPSRSVWPFKWLPSSAKRRNIPAWVF